MRQHHLLAMTLNVSLARRRTSGTQTFRGANAKKYWTVQPIRESHRKEDVKNALNTSSQGTPRRLATKLAALLTRLLMNRAVAWPVKLSISSFLTKHGRGRA